MNLQDELTDVRLIRAATPQVYDRLRTGMSARLRSALAKAHAAGFDSIRIRTDAFVWFESDVLPLFLDAAPAMAQPSRYRAVVTATLRAAFERLYDELEAELA